MDIEELTRYKNMSVEEIDQRLVPDIEDIKNKKNGAAFHVLYESRKCYRQMQLCRKRKKFSGLLFVLFRKESDAA